MRKLSNKQFKQYNRLSRYSNIPYYYNSEDDKYVSGTVQWLDDTTPYTVHIVETNQDFDSISLYYYGNPTYYWVIMDFNRFTDPYEQLTVGQQIKIPSKAYLKYLTQVR